MSDPRIKAVLLSAGGFDLNPFAAKQYPFMNRSFAEMTAPVLVVAGDQDFSKMTIRGPEWFADLYFLSLGAKCPVTLFGEEHSLGGIPGYGVKEMKTRTGSQQFSD